MVLSGATITRGADTFKFLLLNEPEGNADINQTHHIQQVLKKQLVLLILFVLSIKVDSILTTIVSGIASSKKN